MKRLNYSFLLGLITSTIFTLYFYFKESNIKLDVLMVLAILIAVGVMMLATNPLSTFIERHPTIKILALSFMLLIGVMVVSTSLTTNAATTEPTDSVNIELNNQLNDLLHIASGLSVELKLDNSIAYTNYDFFDNQINIPTTFDPSDYFSTGSIKISDNCNQLFFTDNINQLFWYPTYSPEKQAEGIYNVELKLKLIDNIDVLVNTQVEVIRYN
jgi:hypothetical protein